MAKKFSLSGLGDGKARKNNYPAAAERALRFAVLERKGSIGSDSVDGSQFVERFLTVRATLRSQKRDLYAYLKDACTAALPASRLRPSCRFLSRMWLL